MATGNTIAMSVFLCAIYIGISAGLINFNKYLMHQERFPFAMVLTTGHMIVTWISSITLYIIAPSLFPTMGKALENKLRITKYFMPLSLLFAVGVVLSNQAYIYCSVAFLQFMKQGNVVIVFLLSCAMGSQTCNRLKSTIVLWIVIGCCMAVTGELHFVFIGFAIQLVSQSAECGKNIAQEWVLSGSDLKLDPLTYNTFMAPACLLVLSVGNYFTFNPEVPAKLAIWWPYLLPNALMAFALNVTISMLIKTTSAMGFALAGVVKDMVIVTASCVIFGDHLAMEQIIGFSVSTCGIFMWSYCKIQADSLMVLKASRFLGMEPENTKLEKANEEEVQPLMSRKALEKEDP
jgi:hypothetical protein